MEEESKETGMCVSGAEIVDALLNPDKAFDALQEFCGDIKTLTESMNDLYMQHPIEFALLGVEVEVIVKSKTLDKELIHNGFGCRDSIDTILEHPVSGEETVSEEEANGYKRAM